MKELFKGLVIILIKFLFVIIISLIVYALIILFCGRKYLECGETIIYKNIFSNKVKVYNQNKDGNFYDLFLIRDSFTIKNSVKDYYYSITFDSCDNYKINVYFVLKCKIDINKIIENNNFINDDYIVSPIIYKENLSFLEVKKNPTDRIIQGSLINEIINIIKEININYNYITDIDVIVLKLNIKKNEKNK